MATEAIGAEQQAAGTVDLIAVLVAVPQRTPLVLTIRSGSALPSGPFQSGHRSLQAGLRAWVGSQTHHPLGYVEQLYTFADADRGGAQAVSISYLGLTREGPPAGADEPAWRDWYEYFPWEDHRGGGGGGGQALTLRLIAAGLARWAEAADTPARRRRVSLVFGQEGMPWHEELVLQRYELLWEAGLVAESPEQAGGVALPGLAMAGDHRRVLATGIARLRAKIKYRPVVFELLAPTFTLLELQRCVEAIAGRAVHKQNFRRLIEQQELVEETGDVARETGGRPAKLFRFRRAVLEERTVAGTRAGVARG